MVRLGEYSPQLTPISKPNLAKFRGGVALSGYICEISVEGYEDRFLEMIIPKALGA
jgi:hypothetical protein